jgi:hypothetical protein
MKKITVLFFRTTAGGQPVREWLLDLSEADRKIVSKDIYTVEVGWPVGMPVCENITGYPDIKAVRSTIRDGKVEARVYFAIDGNNMILLHGNEGKTNQTGDIRLAADRWAKYKP